MTQDLLGVLRSFGLRATPQRVAVLRALAASSDHPGAEEICTRVRRKIPMISTATVYKILGELRTIGQAKALPFPGKVRFDFGGHPDHHHLVCDRCGRTEDVPAISRTNGRVAVPRRNGYQILGVEMAFRGFCPECQRLREKEQSEAFPSSNKGTRRIAG